MILDEIRRTRQRFATLTIIAGLCGLMLCATGHGSEPDSDSNLDQELLEGLDNDLFDGLDDLPDLSKPETGQPTTKPTDDKPPVAQTDGGEDIGASSDPLTRIGQQMRQVESLIAERQTSKRTLTLQREIVADLDLLIKQIQEQQKKLKSGSGKPSPSNGNPKQGQPKGEPKQQQPKQGDGNKAEDRLDQAPDTATNMKEMRHLIKEVWGHLPDRLREQMQSSSVEQFHPRYEKLIEAYFRRLAEDNRE